MAAIMTTVGRLLDDLTRVCSSAADVDPSWLLASMLDTYTAKCRSALGDLSPEEQAVHLANWSAVVAKGLAAVQGDDKAVSGWVAKLKELAASFREHTWRSAILAGVTRGLRDAAVAVDIDEEYWKNTPTPNREELLRLSPLTWKSIRDEAEAQSGAIRSLLLTGEAAVGDCELSMNASNYAEFAWQEIYALVVRAVLGLKLSLKKNSTWGRVSYDLRNGAINLAMHNMSLGNGNTRRTEGPLFRYHGYEVIVSPAWLRRQAASQDSAIRRVAVDLLTTGRTLTDAELMPDAGGGQMGAFFEGAQVRVPAKTDIDQIYRHVLGRQNVQHRDARNYRRGAAQTALREFLSGDAAMFFGGNNDAAYLIDNFPTRARRFAVLESGLDSLARGNALGTAVYFYSRPDLPEAIWRGLVDLWSLTRELMTLLIKDVSNFPWVAPGEHRTFRDTTREHLIGAVNARMVQDTAVQDTPSIYGGFIKDFGSLRSILCRHNTWALVADHGATFGSTAGREV
ncbi:MAG: hypothetical protein AB7R55_09215 [Gemmatimonadales bacterium]